MAVPTLPLFLNQASSWPSGTRKEEILRDICVTAEEPAVIRIQPDRNEVAADGDVAILTVQLEDAHGTPVPHADRLLYFRVQGGVPIASARGPVSTEPEVFPDL